MQRKSFTYKNLSLSYLDSQDTKTINKSKNTKAETIIITHANGYSAQTYSYYISKLHSLGYRVLALDFSGHGSSDSTLEFTSWDFFRDQLLALIEYEKISSVIGIGHSLGGAVQLRTAIKRPEIFKKVIVFDPVVANLFMAIFVKVLQNPLAKGAIKRRKDFKGLKVIAKAYRRHPSFKYWNENIFNDYLQSCFKDTKNGVTLCCLPEHEAKVFNMIELKALFQYKKIEVETHIVIPQKYQVCSPRFAKKIISNNKQSTFTAISDFTHFFPFENPEWTLNKIKELL